MKVLKLFALVFFASVIAASLVLTPNVRSQTGATEAPAGFDQTNGFEPQGDANTLDTFLGDKAIFEKRDTKETGLGPVYNAQSCAECHQNRATGGVSQILEIRAGHSAPDGRFVPAPGGSLIQTRSIFTKLQERVPDGPRIVFQTNAGPLGLMGFDGGQNGNLNVTGNMPTSGNFPAFSPDGGRIVFTNSGNLWVVNNDGTNPNEITIDGTDFMPAWSPDGTKIAFTRVLNGQAQVWTITPFGTEATNISNSTQNDGLPAYSPDGTKIAFERSPSISNPVGRIWTMNADGSGQTQITNGPGNDERPTYSPDGTQIAFSTNGDGNYEIYKIPAAGGVAVRLTNNPASDRNPSWSPDNTSIAFASDRSGAMNVWSIATDGSNPTQISPPSIGGNTPNYSRDTGENVRTFRSSLNTLGDGFVECIADNTLTGIRDSQPVGMRGTAIQVDILESPDQTRIGRFGWKDSIGTLLTFSAAAYLNEIGITSPLQSSENSSLGRSVASVDTVPDPEDTGGDIGFGSDVEAFTRFMRSTEAPDRDRVLVPDDSTDPGSALFDSLSCSVCHVRSITTAPVGSVINGGTFTVPDALGNKIIHPFSDFLLHDIGTGDGIVETNGETTRNMMRTAPLWGLRTHDKFMHDGGSSSAPTNSGAQSFALNEAILRHAGQATSSRNSYQALTPIQKAQLIRFLKSL
ncbi:MAG TPA: di-heme oxidoredictase family protein [Pyrinomonadaceae bacterium]|nr:di-heme oxidoredictase family protein [Pyrinomonadaceae bacterium]